MKKLHIVALVLIAVSIAVILTQTLDYTSYENFTTSLSKEGKTFNVVGYLAEDTETMYDPKVDPNYFEFYMIDEDSIQQKVVYNAPKPQDFERSEQIVVTGKSKGETFYASKILMKCPSKYVEDEIQIVEASIN